MSRSKAYHIKQIYAKHPKISTTVDIFGCFYLYLLITFVSFGRIILLKYSKYKTYPQLILTISSKVIPYSGNNLLYFYTILKG